MTDTFIHSRSSLENHTWFPQKQYICKVYTHMQTETAQSHILWDGTFSCGLY